MKNNSTGCLIIETINFMDGFINRNRKNISKLKGEATPPLASISESGSRDRKDGFNHKERIEKNAIICAESSFLGYSRLQKFRKEFKGKKILLFLVCSIRPHNRHQNSNGTSAIPEFRKKQISTISRLHRCFLQP